MCACLEQLKNLPDDEPLYVQTADWSLIISVCDPRRLTHSTHGSESQLHTAALHHSSATTNPYCGCHISTQNHTTTLGVTPSVQHRTMTTNGLLRLGLCSMHLSLCPTCPACPTPQMVFPISRLPDAIIHPHSLHLSTCPCNPDMR